MRLRHLSIPAVAIVSLILSFCSVSTETVIQGVLNSAATAPVFLDCRAASSNEICFSFSRPVRLVSLILEPAAELLSVTEGEELVITLARPFREGESIVADILVEDEHRNTLNVLIPLRARNDRTPRILINELRTEYAGATKTAPARSEYIEFITRSAGNLGALRLFITGTSPSLPVFEFPPAEVGADEYIVLHLRTLDSECIDETGDDLGLSGGAEAIPDVRDFWVPGTTKLLHKTDAVYLLDQDDRIVDAVLLSEKADPSWSKPVFAAAADFFASQGAWQKRGESNTPGTYVLAPSDALISAGTTATRTVCRDETLESGGRAENWYITATSSASPGKSNNPKRYVP